MGSKWVGVAARAGASGANNSVDIAITSNTVKSNLAAGIFVIAASYSPCSGNTVSFEISGNTVTDNMINNINVTGGVGTGHEVQGNISNNTIKDDKPTTGLPLPPGDGLNVSGGSGTGNLVHDITISGNVVTGNDRGILVNGGANSVNAVLDGIDVIGNTVKNNKQGILISGGNLSQSAIITDVLIDGNISTDNASQGILVSGGANSVNAVLDGIDVIGNTVKNNEQEYFNLRRKPFPKRNHSLLMCLSTETFQPTMLAKEFWSAAAPTL